MNYLKNSYPYFWKDITVAFVLYLVSSHILFIGQNIHPSALVLWYIVILALYRYLTHNYLGGFGKNLLSFFRILVLVDIFLYLFSLYNLFVVDVFTNHRFTIGDTEVALSIIVIIFSYTLLTNLSKSDGDFQANKILLICSVGGFLIVQLVAYLSLNYFWYPFF